MHRLTLYGVSTRAPLRFRFLLVLAFLILGPGLGPRCIAQDYPPRIGVGVEFLLNPFDNTLTDGNLGLGFRVRGSKPLNADVSLAAGVGFAGFLLSGQANAEYVLNPQVSAIVTLPERAWLPYLLLGVGGFFPISTRDDAEGGLALHAGYGWVRLLVDTSVFIEINPGLLVREEKTTLVLPIRAGIIF